MNDINEILKEAHEAISEAVDPQSPDEMIYKIDQLATLSANVSRVVAKCERIFNEAYLRNYHKSLEDKPPSTVHKKIIDAMTAKENEYYQYSDKILSALKIRIESLRSMIALYRTETESLTR